MKDDITNTPISNEAAIVCAECGEVYHRRRFRGGPHPCDDRALAEIRAAEAEAARQAAAGEIRPWHTA